MCSSQLAARSYKSKAQRPADQRPKTWSSQQTAGGRGLFDVISAEYGVRYAIRIEIFVRFVRKKAAGRWPLDPLCS
jgi:hypothetical protein